MSTGQGVTSDFSNWVVEESNCVACGAGFSSPEGSGQCSADTCVATGSTDNGVMDASTASTAEQSVARLEATPAHPATLGTAELAVKRQIRASQRQLRQTTEAMDASTASTAEQSVARLEIAPAHPATLGTAELAVKRH